MKRKIKRFFNFFIVVTVVVSCITIQGFAVSNESNIPERVCVNGVDVTVDIKEEISRAMKGISDLSCDPIVIASCDVDEELTVETYTTTRKIQMGLTSDIDNSGTSIYATTAVAVASQDKADTGSKYSNYVTAYATIYWTDNFGISNKFLGASGGWDVDVNPNTGVKPTLSNRTITLGAYYQASTSAEKKFTTSSNTFNFSESDFDYYGWMLSVETSVKISGVTKPLELQVASGLLT